jgi:hypothetical protein
MVKMEGRLITTRRTGEFNEQFPKTMKTELCSGGSPEERNMVEAS